MKLKFDKVAKGVGQTQYNQLIYTLEKQYIDFKREVKIKENGADDYFVIVGGLKLKFNCIGEITELTIKENV
jgi:hypothetical protein